MKESSPLTYPSEKGSPWHLRYSPQGALEQSCQGRKDRLTKVDEGGQQDHQL